MNKHKLKDIIYLNDRIDSKLRQLNELRFTMEGIKGIDYSRDKIQTAPTSSVENTIIKIVDYEQAINQDIDKLIDMKDKARKEINKVKGQCGTVLEMRYLECMRWEEIAYRLHYSIRRIYQLHGEGLAKIREDKKKEKDCSKLQ